MPRFISPELLKLILPLAVAYAEQWAASTPGKIDDAIVSAIKGALNDPATFAFLLQLLSGDEPVPVTEDEKKIHGAAPAVHKLFEFADFCHAA